MTNAYDSAVMLAEQLTPVDQARLVGHLAERLQHRLGAEAQPTDVDTDEPAFWNIPDVDAEWAAIEATRVDQLLADDSVEIEAMLKRWFRTPLSEEDALELAMSEDIAEWNLD